MLISPVPDIPPSKGRLAYTLAVLFALNFMNFYDRQVVGAVGERIKQEWQLSDSQLGGLTTAFVLLYALVGIPFGRLADTQQRRFILFPENRFVAIAQHPLGTVDAGELPLQPRSRPALIWNGSPARRRG